jgi:hypothetical protein
MKRAIDNRAVEGILYGVYRALHNVAGASSASIMRRAAPDILKQLAELGVDFSCVDDIEKLESKVSETMVNSGLCEDMTFKLDGDELTAEIRGCAFSDLTSNLKKEGIPPFGCPFAALTLALAEQNLGKRARVKRLEPIEGGNKGDSIMVVELHEK